MEQRASEGPATRLRNWSPRVWPLHSSFHPLTVSASSCASCVCPRVRVLRRFLGPGCEASRGLAFALVGAQQEHAQGYAREPRPGFDTPTPRGLLPGACSWPPAWEALFTLGPASGLAASLPCPLPRTHLLGKTARTVAGQGLRQCSNGFWRASSDSGRVVGLCVHLGDAHFPHLLGSGAWGWP